MCGIAGIINSGPADDAVLDKLEAALAHRGPDGIGRYQNGACQMVHTRLAIIDLEGGDQPFVHTHDDGGEVALIANGEIYNNPELRAHMGDTPFKTRSDCEPPLFLYLKHGTQFAEHLRGMYAIAIWDANAERLVLARDPFGIKPLYWAQSEKGFAFASEPAALVRSHLMDARLNTDVRDTLLQLQFNVGEETMFEGIHRVAPGETLVVENGRISERHLIEALAPGGPVRTSRGRAVDELDRVLADSVGVHQRSDVPYGMFLSGGIDSSALLAMMNRLNETPVVAFTAGFPGTHVADERALARELARDQGADHIEVEFGADDLWALLPRIAKHMDDPAADYAVLPTWKLAEAAHAQGIKVVLTGEGGDELFGGYGRYRAQRRWLFKKNMYRKGMLEGRGVLRAPDAARKWRRGMAGAVADAARPGRTSLQAAQALDISTWLPNDLLGKLDRMLMAHGVEGRVPFLDPKVASMAYALPDALKVHKGLGKWVLRKWLDGVLPGAQPFSRKRGFTVPVGEWIAGRGGDLGARVAAQPGIAEICDADDVKSLFNDPGAKAGKAQWTLLFYAVWHQVHFCDADAEGGVFDILH